MEKKSISIVIAAYCGEKYIVRQLESLFRQTVLPDEIIICDDSPDDALATLVKKTSQNAPCNIKYFKNEKQLGPTQNFAEGLRLASGDILFLCDQDDVWKENKVERLLAELEKHEECEVVFCNSLMVDFQLQPLGYGTADTVNFTLQKAEDLNNGKGLMHLLKTPMLYGHNIAFRRSFLKYLLPIPQLDSHDLFIAELCAGRGKIRCVYENLTFHCRHGANQSTQARPCGWMGRVHSLFMKHRKGVDTELRDSFLHARKAWERLKTFPEGECPEKNLEMLKRSADYYERRLSLTAKPRFLRPLYIFTVKGYFTCGYGLRSILRDLVF
ncbi:MAG: glycosyltransferase [Lentisphaeria bacterium]|nr:glycosyltransferase [Lentisphaeria bacterium]